MLVNWKGGDRILQVPLIDTSKPVTLDNALNHEQVSLHPGWNELPEGQFDAILPHIRGLLDNGSIEYYAKKERVEKEVEVEVDALDKNGNPTKKKTKEVQAFDVYTEQKLEDVRADKAREIVRNCMHMGTLKRWAENPKLVSEIRNLVDMQIQKIVNYTGEVADEMMRF